MSAISFNRTKRTAIMRTKLKIVRYLHIFAIFTYDINTLRLLTLINDCNSI